MRRDFILVGLLVGLFVFPYVLTIEESDAAGEVVDDPKSCTFSANPTARIVCLSNQLRQSSEKFNEVHKHLKETQADLQVCQADLQTVEPEHEGECFEEIHADDEHHASPVGVPGLGSPVWNEQSLTKIYDNVQNIYDHTDQIKRCFVTGSCRMTSLTPKIPAINANLEEIKACTTALKSNKGC